MTTPRETANTLLAKLRIKQWLIDRTKLNAGTGNNYARSGWRARRSADSDARIVRCLDFERALLQLPQVDAQIILLTYREKQTAETTARLIGANISTIYHRKPKAIARLAEILDKNDLL